MARRVRIQITPALFREVIPLPWSADLIGSCQADGVLEVVVESPDLPDVPDGERIPIVAPTFRKNVPVEFVDWGLEKKW